MSYLTRAAGLLLFAFSLHAADLRGIYLYTNDVSKLAKPTQIAVSSALGIPGMDGVAIVIGWDAVEPSLGQYQWTTLDPWLTQATALGKKIDLVVMAGASTPSWLYQSGTPQLNFVVTPHDGSTGQCQSMTMAPPWDTNFLTQWDAMLTALASHLKSINAYDAITLVRITGINRTTEELRIPAQTAQSTGLSCVTDAITMWQQAGYKPSKILQAWDAITTSFKKSFPDKSFAVSIIPNNAFPAIAEDGSVIKGTPPDANQPLMSLANQKFAGHFVVQFDFLMPGEAASPAVIGYAQSLGTLAAFQTNEYLGQTGGGAACAEPAANPTPCTAQTFATLLQTGIFPLGIANPLRAQYIEVFQANANAFPGDILGAHDDIFPVVHRRSTRH